MHKANRSNKGICQKIALAKYFNNFRGVQKTSNKHIFYFSVIEKVKFYEDDTLIYDIQSDMLHLQYCVQLDTNL